MGSALERLKGVEGIDRKSLKYRGTLVQFMSFKLCVITESVKTWRRNDSELVSFNSLKRFVLLCLVMEHQQGSEGFYPKATQYFLPVLFNISCVKNQNKSNIIKA